MPIITKPASIVKDAPNSFSLSKSSLAAVSSVAADAWFSQASNWKKVVVNFISTQGQQFVSTVFDATQSSPTGNFFVVSPCRDNFEIFNIVIHDFNHDTFKVDASELTKSEFDISFAGGAGGSYTAIFTRDFSSPSSNDGSEYLNGSQNISNNLLNLYGEAYGSTYYFRPFSGLQSGKNYKVRFFIGSAPVNFKFYTSWSAPRTLTSEEISQGYFDVAGLDSSYANLIFYTYGNDAGYAGSIGISKYQIIEV